MGACGSTPEADFSATSGAEATSDGDRQLGPNDTPVNSGWIYTDGAEQTDEGFRYSPGILDVITTQDKELRVVIELPNPCTDARVIATEGEAIGVDLEVRSTTDSDTGCAQVITETELVIPLTSSVGDRPVEFG